MSQPFALSELILNKDGSIYHLNLLPGDIGEIVITVGDPDRVAQISRHFQSIEVEKSKREFVTHTGLYHGQRITVIATGIGTDNIDIVFNELDALVNIDFASRQIKPNLKSLPIIRIGTSGALQSDVDLDSFIVSEYAVGFDGLLSFYQRPIDKNMQGIEAAIEASCPAELSFKPQVASAASQLVERFSDECRRGITLTAAGFYGPQGRRLRLPLTSADYLDRLQACQTPAGPITNLEMETAGMYALGALLGHQVVSLNAIVAQRATGEFSRDPQGTVDRLIEYVLAKIAT